MANREACELYIEQEIKEALAEGKPIRETCRDMADWIERYFETKIPAETLRSRAKRIKNSLGSNEPTPPTPQNDNGNGKNQVVTHGGPRNGSGRPAKYKAAPASEKEEGGFVPALANSAIRFAQMAMINLDRIQKHDPDKFKALEMIKLYVSKKEEEWKNGGHKKDKGL